jgi:integrase
MRSLTSQTGGVARRRHHRNAVIVGRCVNGQPGLGTVDGRGLANELGVALVRAVRESAVYEQAPEVERHGFARRSAAGISWYAFALDYLAMRWPLIAAKTRDETNDALCAITLAMVRDVPDRPNEQLLRRALRDWTFVMPRPELRRAPAEVVAVALPDCALPAEGWGRVVLHRTLPQAGRKWTDTGRVHDERGLKSRAAGETRVVPLPLQLVALWQESVDTFGTADDGRLFFNERGGIVGPSTYDRVWHEARTFGLPPELVDSPLVARPYDLRHSALSTWLNAGVDPTEVAERAGNSVEVLLTRYAKCMYGRAVIANQRIGNLFHDYEQGLCCA